MPIPFRAAPSKPPLAERRRRERIAREARHQELIQATFDRAEAHGRLGDFERALEWLDRAAALGGGLPRAYRARRDRWLRADLGRRGAGSWHDGLAVGERARRAR